MCKCQKNCKTVYYARANVKKAVNLCIMHVQIFFKKVCFFINKLSSIGLGE